MLTCRNCDGEFPKPARGRPPKDCPKCRQAAGAPAPVVHLPGAAGGGRNEAAVREQLGRLGVLDSICGMAALDAAIALDTDRRLTGAARAALLKEMRTAATEAAKGAAPAKSRLAELREKRAQRTG